MALFNDSPASEVNILSLIHISLTTTTRLARTSVTLKATVNFKISKK